MIVASLSFLAWITLVIMTFLNPSETLSMAPLNISDWVFMTASTFLAFLLPLAGMRAGRTGDSNRMKAFLKIFIPCFIASQSLAVFAAISYHRDFYANTTQIIILYFIIFLLRIGTLGTIRRQRAVYRSLYGAALIIFIFWMGWLLLMAYAIVTRVEPRWIESTAYNAVNGLLGIVLLLAAGGMWELSRRNIRMENGKIYLDDRNLTSLLSPQENRIALAFISSGGKALNCCKLVRELRVGGRNGETESPDCSSCTAEGWKASNCSVYRNIKNRIADTKKYLELLQIGTIVPVSENPREIKDAGWRLRLFDDVRVETQAEGILKRLLPQIYR